MARAKTITHAAPPPPAGTGLQIPALDAWLINDDFAIPGGGTKRYATPGGAGVGGATEGTAGSLTATLAASAAGDTVICLEGYYSVPNGLTFPAGSSATNPVTVMAKPGAWAVLVRDDDFLNMGLLEAGAGEGAAKTWTLHDAATNTWRVAYAGSATTLEGCYMLNGIAHMLYPYPSLSALMSATDSASFEGKPQTKNEYWFSGTAVSGGFAYIRMNRPNWKDMVQANTGVPHSTYLAWPDDGRYTRCVENGGTPTWFSRSNSTDYRTGRPTIGQGLDPNNLKILLAGRDTTQRLINTASGGFTRFGSGINSMGFRFYATNANNHECHRGIHYVPGYVIQPTGTMSNVTFHRTRLFSYGEHRLQGSYAVMKYDEYLTPPGQSLQASHRNGLIQGASGTTTSNVTFDNCSIYYFHEVMVGSGFINRLRFVNCCFHMVYDEFFQWSTERLAQIEIGYSYALDSAFFTSGSDSGVVASQSPFASEWYHHNIQDQRCPRAAFGTRTPMGGANRNGRQADGRGASKLYNNTMIINPDGPALNTHFLCWDTGDKLVLGGDGSPAQHDEAFNNILVVHDTKRFYGDEGGTNQRMDCVESRALITNGTGTFNRHYRDYNLYYRDVPNDPAIGAKTQKTFYNVNGLYLGNNGPDFDYIRTNTGREAAGVVFFGSSAHNDTVNGIGQPGGWESHGSDADPQIPSIDTFPAERDDYRPRNTTACTAPASAPSGANWWTNPGWTSYGAQAVPFNMAPSAWKGALNPSGTTVPVGVQDP